VSYTLYVIVGLLLLVLFLPWTQNFETNGSLTSLHPEDRPQTVHSTIAGRIEKWYVQEGQEVKKGDTLLFITEIKEKYFDPAFLKRIQEQITSKEGSLSSTKSKSQSLGKQIQALNSALAFSLSKARNKVKQNSLKIEIDSMELVSSRANYKIAKEQFDRQIKLFDQGLKSKTDLETRELKFQEAQAKLTSAENKFYVTKNEFLNSNIELNSIEAEYLDKISKAESELNSTLSYFYDTEGQISKMNNEFANMQIRSSYYYITSPQDGIIVRALKTGIGETIKEGEEILSIMPSNPQLAAQLYVDALDVVLLKPGSKIRLQFEGWPALVFSGWQGVTLGTFSGEVKVIDKIDTKGKYRILVVPDNKNEPWPSLLRIGNNVRGFAMLKDVPVWYEMWRRLNGFPPDFQGNMSATKESKKDKSTNQSDEEEGK
jgi:multidrug resistance efflux pump